MIASVVVLLALSHAPGLLRLLAARLGGMRVDGVVVGALPIWRRGKWAVGALPFGTFVLIAGRDATGVPASPELFRRRAWPWKLLVLLAGPIAFYFVAAGIMTASYVAFGVPAEGDRPLVGAVREGLPAARAGLQLRDEIYAIDHQPMHGANDVAPAIGRGGASVEIEVIRDGEHKSFTVEPVGPPGDRRIGIEIWRSEGFRPAPIGTTLVEGAMFPLRYTRFIVHGLSEIVFGRQKAEFSGPVGIVKVAQRQVRQGLRNALQIAAILSVYFGFWMLWPLPMLDGGQLIGYLMRRRSSIEARDLGEQPRAKMRIPAAVIASLALLSMGAVAIALQPSWERLDLAVLVAALAFGLITRNVAAWSLARLFSLISLFGAPLFVWLSLRPARAWFGLNCPACQGPASAVLAQRRRFGCLRCGSSWLSR